MKIEKNKNAYAVSLRDTRKAALDYSHTSFKDSQVELIDLFKTETVKMLEKYTRLRDELKTREELVQRATNYTVVQEGIIMELRGFVEDLLWGPRGEVMDIERIAKKRIYRAAIGGGGNPKVDRMM